MIIDKQAIDLIYSRIKDHPEIKYPCPEEFKKDNNMAKLTRNETEDGTCKYGLIRMDKIRKLPTSKQAELGQLFFSLEGEGIFESAGKEDSEEAFVIKLKDENAAAALMAYANSINVKDPELATEVRQLAYRAKNRPDKRHPTV